MLNADMSALPTSRSCGSWPRSRARWVETPDGVFASHAVDPVVASEVWRMEPHPVEVVRAQTAQ